MTDKAKLLELADRCEASTGPDRGLTCDIASALGWSPIPNPTNAGGLVGRWYQPDGKMSGMEGPPQFTASLDAAATLVPEGYNWQVGCGNHAWAMVAKGFPPSMRVDPIAATPALALCSGALRARADMVE